MSGGTFWVCYLLSVLKPPLQVCRWFCLTPDSSVSIQSSLLANHYPSHNLSTSYTSLCIIYKFILKYKRLSMRLLLLVHFHSFSGAARPKHIKAPAGLLVSRLLGALSSSLPGILPVPQEKRFILKMKPEIHKQLSSQAALGTH